MRIGAQQRPEVRGVEVDAETRCARSAVDIVAIKMKSCWVYYACKDCHEALAGLDLVVWPREEFDARAILCGACGAELTIREYLGCEARCPAGGAAFNPGCERHGGFYFERERGSPG